VRQVARRSADHGGGLLHARENGEGRRAMGAKGGAPREGALPLPEPFPAKGLRPLETNSWRWALRGNRRARRPQNHQGARLAFVACNPPPRQAPEMRFPKALSLWWGGVWGGATPLPSLTVARMGRLSSPTLSPPGHSVAWTADIGRRAVGSFAGIRSRPCAEAGNHHGLNRHARRPFLTRPAVQRRAHSAPCMAVPTVPAFVTRERPCRPPPGNGGPGCTAPWRGEAWRGAAPLSSLPVPVAPGPAS
jgi:hypothetical protein